MVTLVSEPDMQQVVEADKELELWGPFMDMLRSRHINRVQQDATHAPVRYVREVPRRIS